MTISAHALALIIAAALVVGAVLPLPGGTASPSAPSANVAHALAVPAAELAGPCEGAPQLDAATLALFFAPAVDPGAPVPVAIVDPQTFTVTYGDATYTVALGDGNAATATGPDAASAALLARHVGLCTGALVTTPDDAPGTWTADGRYAAMAASADR